MRYIETVLETDERVLARGRLHWIGPAVCGFTLGCLLLLLARAHEVIPVVFLGAIGSLAILVTPILLIQEWIKRRTTEIAVTSQRVIIKRGLFRRNTIEMNAGQIESVQLNQSILGRLLDFGTLIIGGTGEGREVRSGRALEIPSGSEPDI